ncbi:uncharacterized protein LOC127720436 [Mytilus californianus]|uniref:uncharacterized protein LOC127720436 n=1 Tax=Mytilus californianus TaxID=6549 RepID=UPI0022487069|nr:uncharacterized protein LOC127720436 [Mytilus californianus]
MNAFWYVFCSTCLLSHCMVCFPINCGDGYIQRYLRTKQTESHYICCRILTENCQLGYRVKKCTENLGTDSCEKCPKGQYLADRTNSTNIHPCVHYSCSLESKQVDYLTQTGCHKPCICNTDLNFYGFDSCNCSPFNGECIPGTVLALNGSCLTAEEAEVVESLTKPINPVIIPILEEETTGNKTVDNKSKDGSFKDKRWIITGCSLGALVVIFVIVCCRIYRYKKSRHKEPSFIGDPKITDEENEMPEVNITENLAAVTRPVIKKSSIVTISSDSGVSSAQTNSKESISADSDRSSRKVAAVHPYHHSEDKESNIPLLEDQERRHHRLSSSSGAIFLNRPQFDLGHADTVQDNFEPQSPLHHSFPTLFTNSEGNLTQI